jgi:hypothetical protein
LFFAVVPAWRAARLNVLELIQGRHRAGLRTGRLGRPMIAVQVGLAVVLMYGAFVTTRAFVAVLRTPLGFDPENVISVGITPPRGTTDAAGFYRRIVETVGSRGDVVAAGATGMPPLVGAMPVSRAQGPSATAAAAGIYHVLPGCFEALDIGLLRGRLLTWDAGDTASAVVSESAARALFGSSDPLGRTVKDGRGGEWRVVGLVRNVKASLDIERTPPVFVIPSGRSGPMEVVARVRAHQGSLPLEIRRQLSAVAPGTPVRVRWLDDWIGELAPFKNPRFQTLVMTSFATMALGLTVIGVVGVVLFMVAARTREIGIRAALGAGSHSLVRMLLHQTFLPVAAGLILGLLATPWAARLAEAQILKVQTGDPVMLALAAAAVVVAALLAAYLPARRAARVDPIVVLRAE